MARRTHYSMIIPLIGGSHHGEILDIRGFNQPSVCMIEKNYTKPFIFSDESPTIEQIINEGPKREIYRKRKFYISTGPKSARFMDYMVLEGLSNYEAHRLVDKYEAYDGPDHTDPLCNQRADEAAFPLILEKLISKLKRHLL